MQILLFSFGLAIEEFSLPFFCKSGIKNNSVLNIYNDARLKLVKLISDHEEDFISLDDDELSFEKEILLIKNVSEWMQLLELDWKIHLDKTKKTNKEFKIRRKINEHLYKIFECSYKFNMALNDFQNEISNRNYTKIAEQNNALELFKMCKPLKETKLKSCMNLVSIIREKTKAKRQLRSIDCLEERVVDDYEFFKSDCKVLEMNKYASKKMECTE